MQAMILRAIQPLDENARPLKPEFQEFQLAEANQALLELKARKIRGAKVLLVE